MEGAKRGYRDLFGAKECLSDGLDFFASDGFDPCEDFVERAEAAEVELLAGEIRHAGAGGLEGKHERAFEVILGAEEFFFRDGCFLQIAEFLDHQVDDLADGFLGRTGVDRHHARVGIWRELAENGVGQTLLFANVLEKSRRHAATQKIVHHRDSEAPLVSEWDRSRTRADVNLLEVALGLKMDGCFCGWRGMVFYRTRGNQATEFALDKLEDLLVGDVARRGKHQAIRREPVLKALSQRIAIEFS